MNSSKCVIGLELGSTRIKAVLLDEKRLPFASGSFTWENRLENGIWTYSLDDALRGVRECFAALMADYEKKTGEKLTTAGAMGVSGMMHGYLPFDSEDNQLASFRTWRNTITGDAAALLTEKFGFNVPQRWSIAHLYQAMLNKEEHLTRLDKINTLAGYIHYLLTGEFVLGIGEASGMFPIDSSVNDYDSKMLGEFASLVSLAGYGWDIGKVLPRVLTAGEKAGCLTEKGALLLDTTGVFRAGVPFCPPEGDAGTGMVATNSVAVYTGNVSAGTSDFAMLVTDHPLGVHREIDMVTTPAGNPVAMVHCNNCTTDINAWASLFGGFAAAAGIEMSQGKILDLMFANALEGDPDCGGLVNFNYYSGEGVTDFDEGRPLFVRRADSAFNFANVCRLQLLSALATLKIGLDLLTETESVRVDRLYGHGGFFKAPVSGQKMLSAAVGAPVSVMETAGEGGPYGMALLAAFMLDGKEGETLASWLDSEIFADARVSTVSAGEKDTEGFRRFLDNYKKALVIEKCAVDNF